jgi:predicted nucleotidyltransferase
MPGQLVSQRRKSIVQRKLETAAPAIRTQFGVTKIGIFGSFARGEQTPKSDVDVLVDFAQGYATLRNFASTMIILRTRSEARLK